MKNFTIKRADAKNNLGFALVGAMVILLVVTVLGISVSNTTYLNHLIAVNDKVLKEDFYDQERCSTTARINYRDWLTTNYLTAGETNASFPQVGVDSNANGQNDELDAICLDSNGLPVAAFKVKNIEESGTPINNWEDIADYDDPSKHPANDYPLIAHISKPDPDEVYGQNDVEFRRYLITSYSLQPDRNTVIQEGAFKVFNIY